MAAAVPVRRERADRRHLLERDIYHIDQVPTHLTPALNDKADLELHRIRTLP
ncbi:hypothetical protein [Micromonospora sp. LOL_015]|uniref:hypothetical protein n=1 Tax=Micromonospora sp. LOL_015 TaxID=3345416 RepID=UPI003A83EEE4